MPLFDKLVLKDSNNEVIACFLGRKENYQGIENLTGVEPYNPQTHGPWMPTRRHEIEGSGHAVRVLVSGNGKQTKILVRDDLLQNAISGNRSLIGKQIKIGSRQITISTARISRKAGLD